MWDYVRRLHSRRLGPDVLVQASKIRTIQDIKPSANMILVGEHLPEFVHQDKLEIILNEDLRS